MKRRLTKIRSRLDAVLAGASTDVRLLSDDELAAIATGNPKATAADLSDDDLREIIRKGQEAA